MKHLMIWLFSIVLLCHSALSHGDTFEDRASFTISLVEEKMYRRQCIQTAKENANKFSLTGDTHFAVFWINMYSQDCFFGWNFNIFPFQFNKELRCKHSNQSDPENLSLFLNASSVIDEALNVLKPQQYKQLFRGERMDWPFVYRNVFVEDGFFSSSTDIDVALKDAQGHILLVIQESNGVDISKYVDKDYKNENEMLGTSGKLFKVERNVTDDREIDALMSDFKGSRKYYQNNPKVVLFIREISVSRQEKDNVINEQKHLLEGICSNELSLIVVYLPVIIICLIILCVLVIIALCVVGLYMILWLVGITPYMIWWLCTGVLQLAGGTLELSVGLVNGTLEMILWLDSGILQSIVWLFGEILQMVEF